MTQSNAPAIAELSAAEVIDFLRQNPGFILEQGDLLEEMELRHGNGSSFSLIERQVERLRNENRTLKTKLKDFIEAASSNDDVANRLHALMVALVGESDMQNFVTVLRQHLQGKFGIDYVSVVMLQDMEGIEKLPSLNLDSKQGELFRDVLDGHGALVGRIGHARLNALFGDVSDEIESAAVIALGGKMGGKSASKPVGLLALGSSQTERFATVSGTDLLNRMGGMLGALMLRNVADRAKKLKRVK